MYRCIYFNVEREYVIANSESAGLAKAPAHSTFKRKGRLPSICAVARWIHQNIERGNISYPTEFSALQRPFDHTQSAPHSCSEQV